MTRSTYLVTSSAFICLLLACNLFSEVSVGEATEPPFLTIAPHTWETPATLIPHPESDEGEGITPAIPEGATYVGGASCSDSGPGDSSTPFCTFEVALSHLQASDTLVIKAGTYSEPLHMTNLSGTAGAPITIRGEWRDAVAFDGGCPSFPCSIKDVEWQWDEETGVVSIQDSNFITLRDFTVQNGIAAGVSVFGETGIVIENLKITGTGNAGLLIKYTSNLSVENNDIGQVQLGWRDEGGQVHFGAHEALSIVAVSNFVVAHNYVHDTPKEGIDVKESSSSGNVHHNTVERACSVGIYINEAHDVRVYGNQVRRSGHRLAENGQVQLCGSDPVFGDDYGEYYGNGFLLAVGDLGELSKGKLSKIQVFQNVVWDSHGNGLQFWDELRESGTGTGEMTGNTVYNNVFYNSGLAGIRMDYVDDSTVTNNVLALNDEEGITGNAIADNTVSHNLFYFLHDWHQPVGSAYVIGDPLLLDPANGDFQLQKDSPAIDKGVDMGLHYSGSAPDMGAHEFGTSGGGSSLVFLPLMAKLW